MRSLRWNLAVEFWNITMVTFLVSLYKLFFLVLKRILKIWFDPIFFKRLGWSSNFQLSMDRNQQMTQLRVFNIATLLCIPLSLSTSILTSLSLSFFSFRNTWQSINKKKMKKGVNGMNEVHLGFSLVSLYIYKCHIFVSFN